jgi:hypothetical protein
VEFRFSRDGALTIDGRWRYGTSGEWREDWDVTHQDGEAPEELKTRLEDDGAFCEKP